MLHLVVNTHTAGNCALRGDEAGDALVAALRQLQDSAADHGVTIEGWWAYRTAHEMYILVDAADAHTVEDALIAAALPQQTSTRVLPVASIDEVLAEEA